MPNRIIKESIWDSPSLNNLSNLAERHFYKLLPLPDDHGCWQATPSYVKGRLYPRRGCVTEKQIQGWHDELTQENICKFWSQDGRIYGIFVNWEEHQRIRSVHQRKTPSPPEEIMQLIDQIKDRKNKEQLAVNCRQLTSDDGLNPNPNPSNNLSSREERYRSGIDSKPKKCGKDVDSLAERIFKKMPSDIDEKKEVIELNQRLVLLTCIDFTKEKADFGFLRGVVQGKYCPEHTWWEDKARWKQAWETIQLVSENSWKKIYGKKDKVIRQIREVVQNPNKYKS